MTTSRGSKKIVRRVVMFILCVMFIIAGAVLIYSSTKANIVEFSGVAIPVLGLHQVAEEGENVFTDFVNEDGQALS